MDSENQTNINPIGQVEESGIQSGESFTQTSIPISENMDGGINQELDTNSLISIQENNTGNRYELKPKKTKKGLYFLLGVLVGILLCLCYSLLLNNNGISNSINDTINSLSNKIGILSNTVNSIVVDKSKLSGTYATDNSKYTIDFNKDNTLRWRQVDEYTTLVSGETKQGILFPELKQQTQQHESFYEGTYEYKNGEYILYVKGGYFAADTVFHAAPQPDGSLRIAGGTVHNELFRKKT